MPFVAFLLFALRPFSTLSILILTMASNICRIWSYRCPLLMPSSQGGQSIAFLIDLSLLSVPNVSVTRSCAYFS